MAVIKNETEFICRVEEAVRKQGYHFVCGNVDYQPNKKLGKPVDLGHHMILKMDMKVDISAEVYKDILLEKRDAFCKSNTYKNQNEWRIALYRGELSTDAYKLELGDISDIVTWIFVDKMDKLFFRKVEKKYATVDRGYYGTASREEQRDKFYRLGNNEAEMFATVG